MLFACVCWDKPHMGETRERVFHDHLAYLGAHADMVRNGGPMLDDDGAMIGTLLIIDAPDGAAAHAFMDGEVFNCNGVFESVKIRRYRQFQPPPEPGDSELADGAAQLAARQDDL